MKVGHQQSRRNQPAGSWVLLACLAASHAAYGQHTQFGPLPAEPVATGDQGGPGSAAASPGGSNGSTIPKIAVAAAGSLALGTDAMATGVASVAVGGEASGSSAVSIGQGSNASGQSSVAIGSASTTSEDYTVSFGNSDAPRRLLFVAPGTAGTDAVNREQLDAVQTATDQLAGQINGESVQLGAGATALVPGGIAVGTGAAADSEVSIAIGSGAHAVSSVAIGANSQAVGLNTTAVGDFAAASGARAVAIGDHADAQADNSVALGANSVATRANSVEVGNRQITGLAPGTASSDAATLGQLNALGDQFNARMRNMDARLHKLSAGVAIAMAAAQPVVLDKKTRTAVGLGTGYFDSQSAGAVSVSHLIDEHRNVVISGSAGLSGSTSAFRLGVSWSF